MSYPKVVALDTDWTIWKGDLNSKTWGRGRGAYKPVEDNIEPWDPQGLHDRSDHNKWVRAFDHVSGIIRDVLANGAKLAIVSRNPSKAMTGRALYYLKAIDPSDNLERSIVDIFKYNEVADESTVQHFRRIRAWSDAADPPTDFSDLLMFDDEAFNNIVRIEVGVTFQFVRDGQGLTWEAYKQGLEAWRRARDVMIFSSPAPVRKHIGYSGLPESWIQRVGRGEGIVDRKIPYRWGYALYITDAIQIAKYFANLRWSREKSEVCEVWVKDYDAWARINKIWVPESSRKLPMTSNMTWTDEYTGRSQEDRDRIIAENWNIYAPYALFSQHHRMLGMPIRGRWSEMVVYTQIQRSLFEVVPLSADQVNQHPNPNPFPFDRQIREWNIAVPNETNVERQRYREPKLQ
jgi:magnesium-dependent phosphatase 1